MIDRAARAPDPRTELEAAVTQEVETVWLPLLKTDGQWDEQKIRNELHDLVFIYKQVAEVYEHVTGGRLSKPMYYAEVITALFDDQVEERAQQLAQEMREDAQS